MLWLAGLVLFWRGSLGKEEVWVLFGLASLLVAVRKNCSGFTRMCKLNLLYGNRWKTLILEASHTMLPFTVAEDSYKLYP